jgi:transcriptional regulator with XRE-family HTH domain
MGLTQAELGAKLRVTDQTVARWEKGQTDPGPADMPIRIRFSAASLRSQRANSFF